MATKKTTSDRRAMVVGAAGGLGVHLVRALSEAGWEVVAVDRRELTATGRESLLEGSPNITWHQLEGRDEAIGELMAGCQAVINAAATVNISEPYRALALDNVELPRRLYMSARDAGVEQVVQISCASVYDGERGVRTEDSPVDPYNDYERTKIEAEHELEALRAGGGPALTILRPGLLYGPGCTEMSAGLVTVVAILRDLASYLPGLRGGPRTNWCHAADVASAVMVALTHPEGRDTTLNVGDDTALSFGEVLTSIAEGYGIDLGPSVPMPTVTFWAMVSPLIDNDFAFGRMRGLLRLLWKRIQREHRLSSPLRPRLDRSALFYVREDAVMVSEKLRQLGWAPAWKDFRQGIVPTIRWYQQAGWVPRFDTEALQERRDGRVGSQYTFEEQVSGELEGSRRVSEVRAALVVTLEQWPAPPMRHEGCVEGTLSISGLALEAPLLGTVVLDYGPLPTMRYEFGFKDDEGRAHRLSFTRAMTLPHPLCSWSSARGDLIDQWGDTLGRVTLNDEGEARPRAWLGVRA
ncbi:NAD(P)-dependent oxidoreductase [Bradymonadaceae bacterium TMQ3]|uniref:NAD(P)-dependent oxidoreductase n=1 Tax=Lujinxingia sediminis TaxID=2480984 RepID=A0ABY0CU00_9DELT|nr:NAD(P)-dependent oxidoreductase [Lujinxingia sediminis]RDV38658.1 NAD(P)-dependent oxidoreductase [Bradymonadaceae bacterium TMQ3]RVU44790.1 NAD(P)-dependent oxidoreductase [Lujinxingia sediminis]TXC76569.1 NAD(P)-dependent oxidoreductase [Bradymonadales bacterium TMQ1]